MDRKSANELQAHMLGTYSTLRVMLTAIGVALPVVVVGFGWIHTRSFWIGPSISDYYYLPPRFPFFTTRDFFVGGLLGAAVCLYSYKGFSTRENLALNMAAVFALFVAVLPTAAEGEPSSLRSRFHGTAAVLFFLCLAYVSIRRSRDTLRLLPQEKQARYARLYFFTGAAMFVSPFVALALEARSPTSRWILLAEWFGVWAFAAYWGVKTVEMRETRADRDALDAELKRELVPPIPPVGDAAPSRIDRAIRRVMVPNEPEVERIVPTNE